MLVALIAAVLVLPGAPVGAQGGASATLEDQASGGATVTVAQATLPDGGFLAIHDATLQDGQVLKSVRGASSFLPAGSHEDITVHLDDPLTEDTTLIAMPHKDTDDDRIYSFVSSGGTVDGPYTSGGDIVVNAAEVKASATITFEEQPTDGDSILISSVEMIDGGFIAVHDSSLLDGAVLESVIGVSPFLAPGLHKDVRVELDDTVTSDDTLIPMPHKDTNDNEVYDFITSEGADDGPYTDHDGEIVLAPAEVTTGQPASVTFQSQPTGGTLVDVEEVYLPEGGFVTIHDSTLTEMAVIASVRGSSDYLEPGLHKHVVLELDDPFNLGDNAIAMPHQDTDDDESYDFVTSGGTEDGPYTEGGEAVTDDGVLTISASVHAHDQASNGRTLQIAYADLSEGGFIAVHDTSLLAGDVIPSVVGHSEFLEAGEHRDLTIQLDPGINETQILLPMPHEDTDGDESYDFVTSQGADDGPYVDGEGNPVVDTAHVAVTAWVDFRDQSTDGTTITVDAVTMHDGGFVAIHDSSLLDGEVIPSVIGVSDFLAPGTHTDLQVSLDPALDTGETLFAMPHLDTNGNEAYDFIITEGSEDGPYTSDDGPVLQAGQATVTDDGGDGGDGGNGDGGAGDGGDGDGTGDGDDGMEEAPGPGLLAAIGVLAAIAALRRRRG